MSQEPAAEDQLVASAWAELERQRDVARGELGWVDRDYGVIDGQIDMLALVKAINQPRHGEEASVTNRQLRDLVSRWRRRTQEYRAAYEPEHDQAQRNEGLAAGYASAAIDLENLLRGEPLRG